LTPSDPICFSCPDDLAALVAKFQPFAQAGARTFMVSFDDVHERLTNPADMAAYGDDAAGYGRASGDLLNRVYDALQTLQPGAQLLAIGADYAGTTDSPYLAGLRETLRPAVQLLWTGTRVRAAQWRAADAQAYGALIGRTPIVWDNWTNDDGSGNGRLGGTVRLFLGPYTRPASITSAVAGFFFNPANESDLNILPLATAGQWLQHPYRYDPRTAWLKAVQTIAGNPVLAEYLRGFAASRHSTELGGTQ